MSSDTGNARYGGNFWAGAAGSGLARCAVMRAPGLDALRCACLAHAPARRINTDLLTGLQREQLGNGIVVAKETRAGKITVTITLTDPAEAGAWAAWLLAHEPAA